MTFLFFKAPSHFIHFIIGIILCSVFFITDIIGIYFFLPRYARDLTDNVKPVLIHGSFYALAMTIPSMPFVSGMSGFHVPALNLFTTLYFIWQVTFVAIRKNINWRRLVLPFSLSSLCGWIIMNLVNYWFFGTFASWLWPYFRAI